MDRHSRTLVSTGPCTLIVAPPTSRWGDGEGKGHLGDDLSSFHHDTLPWTPAVCPRTALFPNDSTKVHKYIVSKY